MIYKRIKHGFCPQVADNHAEKRVIIFIIITILTIIAKIYWKLVILKSMQIPVRTLSLLIPVT